MKTLTLTQPWATLVAIGAKRIETRSWSTKYRGPLAIHAAQRVWPYYSDVSTEPFARALRGIIGRNEYGALQIDRLPRGVVVATCRLADVARVVLIDGQAHADLGDGTVAIPEEELPFGDFRVGRFAWLFLEVRPLDEPIPAKGTLGLWEWEPPEAGQ